MVRKIKKAAVSKPETLEERVKRIEKEMKFHQRVLNVFLVVNSIVILVYQIIPLIMEIF